MTTATDTPRSWVDEHNEIMLQSIGETSTYPVIFRCLDRKACKRTVRYQVRKTTVRPRLVNPRTGFEGKGKYSYDVISEAQGGLFDQAAASVRFEGGRYVTDCPSCGGKAEGRRIQGYVTDDKCDARCTNARGFNCECACGGKNHGASYGR